MWPGPFTQEPSPRGASIPELVALSTGHPPTTIPGPPALGSCPAEESSAEGPALPCIPKPRPKTFRRAPG